MEITVHGRVLIAREYPANKESFALEFENGGTLYIYDNGEMRRALRRLLPHTIGYCYTEDAGPSGHVHIHDFDEATRIDDARWARIHPLMPTGDKILAE